MAKKNKAPWPTKDVMSQIYEMHLWGGFEFDYYSGYGSHNKDIVKSYLEAIIRFFKSFDPLLSVCDLGCGDFNIGKHLYPFSKKYIAIDIVENLITRNKNLCKANNLEFHCLDITKDDLPVGNCIILRQVLQHLSNKEIQSIVEKIARYKYVIITEHIPRSYFIPNKDIIAGQGIRLKQNSGVDLKKAPFNLKIKKEKRLDTYIAEDQKSQIVTMLYEMF